MNKPNEQLMMEKGSQTIHEMNLQTLMVEIYKTINHINPAYM